MLVYHGRKLDIIFDNKVNELDSLMEVYEVGFLSFVGEGHSQLQCMMQKHRLIKTSKTSSSITYGRVQRQRWY